MNDLEDQIDALALFLVKHDALEQQEDDYARSRIKQEGLKIVHEEEVHFTPEIAWEFYHDKRDEKFVALSKYITAGKSLAMVVQGPQCCTKLYALKQEMRSKFDHGDVNTGTHSSDDAKSAIKEMQLLGILY